MPPKTGNLTEAEIGVIRKAMAFRVKYRVAPGGKVKRRVMIATMGVHPCNRGGVYPNEDRVKNLGLKIFKWGADQEEADHNGVMVEAIPDTARAQEGVRNLPERYTAYNKRKCSEKPLFSNCFEGNDVLYGNLSHNHLLLVLLCWAKAAQWDEPELCDAEGALDLAAVAAKDPAFGSLVSEGLLMEQLSYKMHFEEPDAACLISNALNKGQEAACKTSELTALAVLTGQVTLHAEQNNSQAVAYETIKEKLRGELDYYVDEPEFIEMFECVVSLGANNSSYIQELIEFGDRFVDSKFRQLRLNAFTEVNKMPVACPRSKIAVFKRAYRKKPSYGYCPSPEATWGKIPLEDLRELEDLLQFFHVECQPAVAEAMPGAQTAAFLTNIDVAASEAFVANAKDKARKEKVLEATTKYYWQLKEKSELMPKTPLQNKFAWMIFPAKAESSAPQTSPNTAVAASQPLLPKVLSFNADTGELVGGGQDSREPRQEEPTKEVGVVSVPWREWRGLDMCDAEGEVEGDMAAVLGVLRMLHVAEQKQMIDVLCDPDGKGLRVVASKKLAPNELELPPCVPKSSKVWKESSNPRAISISVLTKTPTMEKKTAKVAKKESEKKKQTVVEQLEAGKKPQDNEAAVAVQPEQVRTRKTYFVHPEWVMPGKEEATKNQVQDASSSDSPAWKWEVGVTMHPFWAVRRLAREQVESENLQMEKPAKPAKGGKAQPATHSNATPLKYNCELKPRQFSVCHVGVFQSGNVSNTLFVEVPLMTNFLPIEQGQELLFEVVKKEPSKKRGATWKDESTKPAKAPKAKAQKPQPENKKVAAMEI